MRGRQPGATVQRDLAIIREHTEGVSIPELAQRYGLTRAWVYQIIRRTRLPKPLSERETEELAHRKALLRKFDAEYGRSPNSLEEFNAWCVLQIHPSSR